MRITALILTLLLSCNLCLAQRHKKDRDKNYVDPDAELKLELVDYKKKCRIALKPYRYDGQKTTFFTYRSYEYSKEVEIATIQNTDYRFSINSRGIHHDKIRVEIYDRPKGRRGRILLYEKDDVGGSEFIFETAPLLEKLKARKTEKGVDPAIVERLRLKKLYLNYIIPSNIRKTEVDPETGKEKVVSLRGAMIVCIGYLNR